MSQKGAVRTAVFSAIQRTLNEAGVEEFEQRTKAIDAGISHFDSLTQRIEFDDPNLDCTDFAHPAWWRGHDHTFRVMCTKVNDVLDGKDDGRGVSQEPWESTRRRLIEMQQKLSPPVVEQIQEPPKTEYAYSSDEEMYFGRFPSIEDAAAEGFDVHDYAEVMYVGEIVPCQTKSFIHIDYLLENIGEAAYDQVGEAADDWLVRVPQEKIDELKQVIADFIDSFSPPRFYNVKNVKTVSREGDIRD